MSDLRHFLIGLSYFAQNLKKIQQEKERQTFNAIGIDAIAAMHIAHLPHYHFLSRHNA